MKRNIFCTKDKYISYFPFNNILHELILNILENTSKSLQSEHQHPLPFLCLDSENIKYLHACQLLRIVLTTDLLELQKVGIKQQAAGREAVESFPWEVGQIFWENEREHERGESYVVIELRKWGIVWWGLGNSGVQQGFMVFVKYCKIL